MGSAAIPVYSPETSTVVTDRPWIVFLATRGVEGLPPDALNCSAQRSMFACTSPPCPASKKDTEDSAVPASPGAGGILWVAARMGVGPSLVHPEGAVHRSPPAVWAEAPKTRSSNSIALRISKCPPHSANRATVARGSAPSALSGLDSESRSRLHPEHVSRAGKGPKDAG